MRKAPFYPAPLVKILAVAAAVVCAATLGVVLYASYTVDRTVHAPLPPIAADRSPAGVRRGAAIFHATCEACHRSADSDRASGAPIRDAPQWLGSLHSGNITSDPHAGIGSLSDALVARMIRFGVNRAGHWAPMPNYAMSDADLAAVIGFLRSDDPLFRPDPRPAPRTTLTLAGKVVLVLTGALTPPDRPAAGIVAPARARSAAYGRYLSEGVYQCGDCHTPGFDSDKIHSPNAFAGGAEVKNAAGELILTPNLTRDQNAGIGRWSRDQFKQAIRDGIRPDGSALSYPMLRFRGADDLEVDALFAFLRSLPAQSTPVPGRRPAIARAPRVETNVAQPEALFSALGCVGCHGQGSTYEAKLKNAAGKPTADVARWIRNPETFLPGTPMPTYAAVLDEPAALALAAWIQQGGPNRANTQAHL